MLLLQTASFAPKVVFGLLYWHVLYPIHRVIYSGLSAAVARTAPQVSTSVDRSA